MKQVFHHYEKWEEYKCGMWRTVSGKERKDYFEKAVAFTGDYLLYGKWMMEVIKKWPVSCEHNLTDTSQNRRAWVGHAACCLAFRCPEDIVREAWGYLSKEQQDLANAQADAAIAQWEIDNKVSSRKEDYAQALFDF